MTTRISVTVNGEAHSLSVPPRTQLAEVLRDHLELTGTHLGCEQGVCGACTVMVDGRPVRSCITFAAACDGARIETIEGYREDPVMDRLRDAFSRHHALQCGFCTPGMLATARDIVRRLDTPDEAAIRHELSGNLCRCTGYVGIVNAIRDVIEQRDAEGVKPAAAIPRNAAPRAAFTPFEPEIEEARPAPAAAAATGTERSEGNWTIVERSFPLAHPPAETWALFSDISRVAACMPGAVVDSVGEDDFTGAIEIRFGPIQARFGGSGTYRNDDTTRSGKVEARGEDRNGKSSVRGDLSYRIEPGGTPDTSQVAVDLRYEITGPLAQFNRPELVSAFIDYFLNAFASNCDAVLSGEEAPAQRKLSAFRMAWIMLRSLFRRG